MMCGMLWKVEAEVLLDIGVSMHRQSVRLRAEPRALRRAVERLHIQSNALLVHAYHRKIDHLTFVGVSQRPYSE